MNNYDERKTNENGAPSLIVKIKDVTGTIQKYIVSDRPEWADDGLIYITHNERGMIVYNSRNIVSYSEKVIVPRKNNNHRPTNEVDEDEEN